MQMRVSQERCDDIEYEVRFNKRARRMSLKVGHDGRVWVSVPPRTPLTLARSFVASHVDFIRDKLPADQTNEHGLQRELLWEGIWCTVAVVPGLFVDMYRRHTELVFEVPDVHSASVALEATDLYLQSGVARARETLPNRVAELANITKLPVKKVRIGDQKSLWGSCSHARRVISLNWRVALFPESVQDYLIYHELAHLIHPNHSHRFWALVESYDSLYRESEHWLNTHGAKVMSTTVEIKQSKL